MDITAAAVAGASEPALDLVDEPTFSIAPPLVAIRPVPRRKRALDIVVASTLLVISAPLFLLIALIVRRDGGPVLFSQRRVGTGGRIIEVKKLRSMASDAEDRLRADPDLYARYISNGFKLPADEDPRVTRWGRFLRASSLDELPQLVSVICGDMTMVGPRPIVEPELDEYRTRGAEKAYLSTRPGLTGLWQVSGRSLVGYDERVVLDLQYLEQQSLALDLKILAKTVLVVLRREGAH